MVQGCLGLEGAERKRKCVVASHKLLQRDSAYDHRFTDFNAFGPILTAYSQVSQSCTAFALADLRRADANDNGLVRDAIQATRQRNDNVRRNNRSGNEIAVIIIGASLFLKFQTIKRLTNESSEGK